MILTAAICMIMILSTTRHAGKQAQYCYLYDINPFTAMVSLENDQ